MIVPESAIAAAVGVLVGLLLAAVAFLVWRTSAIGAIRRDAIRRSTAIISGKVHEQLVPYLPGFEFDPRDARFLGSPIDLVVFDGLSVGAVSRIVFVEIKTGGAGLTAREEEVREAVRARRVEWRELRVTQDSPG